ncbi:MAG: 16S rRNA (cytidine(1402)-2'-O)-methyltransferase [Rhodospirillales bacterium]|nr:16S rRNA (cytidine(1402)-2'-O)-methyltransferase [Rhodospirillales bacterium]
MADGDDPRPQDPPNAAHVSQSVDPSKPDDDRAKTGLSTYPPALYLVATPIGHAADITLRALAVLSAVDAIACEDTRTTAKLLALHSISRPLVAYHEHNEETMAPRLIARILAGERIALVSDAGTPLISDPGYRLLTQAIAAGVRVVPVPGASAILAAVAVAGLPSHRIVFEGFLPARQVGRRRALETLRDIPATLVIFEAPQRLAASLADMADVLGPRPAVIARELTKMFETVHRDSLPALAAAFEQAGPPKGEITIVVAPPAADAPALTGEEVDTLILTALSSQSPSQAAATVATATGLPRRRIYARVLEIAGQRG